MFLLSCNLGEVVVMFIVLLIGWQTPLLAIQLLWINLVTDSFPAVALGMDKGEKGIMTEKPRSPSESFFSHGAGKRTIFFGILVGIATIIAFYLGYSLDGNVAQMSADSADSVHDLPRTMAFITLVFAQMFFALSIRSEHESLFSKNTFSNWYLIAAIFIGMFLQVLLVNIPFLANIFHLTGLPLDKWFIVIGIAIMPMLINEIRKFMKN